MSRLLSIGIGCLVLTVGAAGSPVEPPATLPEALARIAELEARVAKLESQLAAAGVETRRLEAVARLEPKGEPAQGLDARFDVRYNAAAGRTTVVGPVLPAASNRGLSNTRFLVAPAVAFAGERPANPAETFDFFVATRGHTNNRLRTLEVAELVIDGAVVEVPVAEYVEEGRMEPPRSAGRARRGAAAYDERLRLTLDRDAMTRLAHATDGGFRLGGLELTLTREHLAVVRATLLRGTPGD